MQRCARARVGGLRPARCAARHTRTRHVRTNAFDSHLASGVLDTLSNVADHAPLAFERVVYPCHSMNCGDAVYRSTLDPNLRMEDDGISPFFWVILGVLLTYLTATPGVIQGFVDTYIVAPILGLTRPSLKRTDIKIGNKLAEGGFGTVYYGEAVSTVPGQVEKGEKLIVKKANEFGEAEVWMNERLSRAAPQAIATYLTAYADGPPQAGTPLVLAWKFEGKATLDEVMKARDFPQNVEQQLLGRKLRIKDATQRRLAVLTVIMRQMLTNLEAMHRTGIVHRDVKPQNMILSPDGLRMIDLGAGADLRVGINYIPNEYLLDPRFAPPQQYVMSPLTPRAPPLPLAALLSPVLWRLNQPDRFDMYSAGIILFQLCFPSLRNDAGLIAFNKKLEELDWDLSAWRASVERQGGSKFADGFKLLDARDGAGWELATKLLEYDHYQRFSAKQALAHRWLAKGNPVTTPLARARSSVVTAVDRAIAQLFDTKAFMGMRDSLSEAELYSALNEDEEPEAPARGTSQTVAWWQERSKDQKRPGGVIGKIFNPASEGQRRARAGGNATQRAFQSSDGSVDFGDADSGNGASGGGNGAKPRHKQRRRRQPIEPPPLEGHPELEPALKKAGNAGIFSMFDRLK